jgi:hypothetical protein
MSHKTRSLLVVFNGIASSTEIRLKQIMNRYENAIVVFPSIDLCSADLSEYQIQNCICFLESLNTDPTSSLLRKYSFSTQYVLLRSAQSKLGEGFGDVVDLKGIDHVLSTDSSSSLEFFVNSLFRKVLRTDHFNPETLFSKPPIIQNHIIKCAEDRATIRLRLIEFVKSFELGAGRSLERVSQHAAEVQEELIMNAVWDANPLRSKVSRQNFPALKADEHVAITWAFDGQFLAVVVRDPFGSFPHESVKSYQQNMLKSARFEGLSVRTEGEGAGIGLYMILGRVFGLEIIVKPKVATQVVAVFNVLVSPRVASRQTKSFLNFRIP